MPGGHPALIAALRERIQQGGPIPFVDFMRAALYDPQHGYYCRDTMTTGRCGDFYTSPDVSEAFGRLVARQVTEIADRTGCHAGPFHLIEAGPGTGRLTRDMALGLAEEHPALASRTVLTLVEVSPALARAQQELLMEVKGRVAAIQWVAWRDLVEGRQPASPSEGFAGCVVANEFLDALPVHVVQKAGDGLREVRVDWRDGAFAEDLEAPAPARVQEHFDRLNRDAGVDLPEGHRAEAGLAGLDWVSSLGALFGQSGRGGVVIVDYGYPAAELHSAARARGTLLCYHRHQALDDPLAQVGEQDMTAHVDFSSIAARARTAGFSVAGPVTQTKFLVALGLASMLAEAARDQGAASMSRRLGLHQLMAPGGMGDVFKVMLLARGTEAGRLTGALDPFRGPHVSSGPLADLTGGLSS